MKIYTLGNFDIQVDNDSIMQNKGYPHRTIKLFKYFLTFKGKRLLPENIIEDLWSDNDFTDPKNVLRTQISRVRNMINEEKYGMEKLYDIIYKNGYYVFEIKGDPIIDVELFEVNMTKGSELKSSNPMEALRILQEGLELYKGQYLQEMEYEEWIVPIRNRYHRLYLKGLMSYIEILNQKGMNEEVVKICEDAIHHEPYGEVLHIYFMEALMAIGEKRYAISHYEYITSRLYSNLGITPSEKMKILYKKLQVDEKDMENSINLNNVDVKLETDVENAGVLICEPSYFKFLYNLEIRRKSRSNVNDKFFAILTIDNEGYDSISHKDMEEAMSILINMIYINLRKGDVLSKWNENQLVSLLYGVEKENLEIIADRLKKKYQEQIKNTNITLNIRFKSI